MAGATRPTVLHYTGYDCDRGGIVTIIRHLAAHGGSDCRWGANRGARQERTPPLPVVELPAIDGEKIDPVNAWRARAVARVVKAWLAEDAGRIFHGHSRAGLLVALWLRRWGEERVVASVHCYGRRRWFYRWAARALGGRLFWLSPAMKRHYAVPRDDRWAQCIPGGVPASAVRPAEPLPGRLRLGGVGELARWKQWEVAIDALASLPEAIRTRVSFEHIGAGDSQYAEELRQRAVARGVETHVKFRGAEPSADRLLAGIDVLVVTSAREPFSLAVLEALAAGVPVLAADSGGAVDIVEPGKNGGLYATGDARALASQLAAWVQDPPAWDRAGIRATAVSIERVAAQWLAAYAGLEGTQRGG